MFWGTIPHCTVLRLATAFVNGNTCKTERFERKFNLPLANKNPELLKHASSDESLIPKP